MARLPELQRNDLNDDQRVVWDTIAAGPRGGVRGPLNAWLNSPALAARAQELGEFCRYQTRLPPRLSELVILVMGAHWRAGYEWATHAPIAAKAGLDPACIEDMRRGATPAFPNAVEQAVYNFSHELVTSRVVSEATYAQALQILGREALVELVGILGYYTLISMTINAFEIPVPEGQADPFV